MRTKLDYDHEAAARIGAAPAEIVFVDDTERNVVGAREAGMAAELCGSTSTRQTVTSRGCGRCSRSTACNSVEPASAPRQGGRMASFISHTTIDCRNAYELSEWWKPVLGYVDIEGDPNEPGHEECMIRDPESGHQVLFIEVPEPVVGKNWHFDVRPRERTRDEEVAWLLEYGATLVADHRGIYGPGSGWVTLADPDGNQLCVLRSVAELG